MRYLRAYLRLSFIVLMLISGTALFLLTAWIPLNIRRIRFSAWFTMWMGRIALWILGVKVEAPSARELNRHEGFLFPNHCTYLDILLLVAILPVRFVAKEEVRRFPLIGYLATAVGCVFVRREDKESRTAARQQLAEIEPFPPIVLYPEGTRNPGQTLLPFRYGAFEIAVQGQRPFIPVAIIYDRPDICVWSKKENIVTAVLRLAGRQGAVKATVRFLPTVYPQPADDPVTLAETTHAAMLAVLSTEGAYQRVS